MNSQRLKQIIKEIRSIVVGEWKGYQEADIIIEQARKIYVSEEISENRALQKEKPSSPDFATPRQKDFLITLGHKENMDKLTKAEAHLLIESLKNKKKEDQDY